MNKEEINFIDNLSKKAENKYLFEANIAQGGMKEIYSVKDRDTARNIAMAVMLDNENSGTFAKTEKERFIYEARISANLEHPNICPIHDIGIDENNNPYFTMKLIGGEDFQKIIDMLKTGDSKYQEKYTIPYLLEIFKNICQAIAFAHSKGVIHLDLKPENIQVGEYGEVLVLDWGLAKLLSEKEEDIKHYSSTKIYENLENSNLNVTLDGVIKGTLGYMSPEQASGENSKKDVRSDIYGLCGILYSILTYEKPIGEDNVNLGLIATINGEIYPPKMRTPQNNIPSPLEAIAMKGLEIDRDERYQGVNEIIEDLDAYTAGFATAAENANIFMQLFLLIKRNKAFFITCCIATFAIIAIIMTYMIRLKNNEEVAFAEQIKAEKSEKEAGVALAKIKKISKQAAPEFLTRVEREIELQNWEEALKFIKIAKSLDDQLLEISYQKGRIFLGMRDLHNAHIEFQKSKRKNKLTKITELFYNNKYEFNDKIAVSIASIAYLEDDYPLMIKLCDGNDNLNEVLKIQIEECMKEMILLNSHIKKWDKASKYLKIDKDSFMISTYFHQLNLKNIKPLAGLLIKDLNLTNSENTEDIEFIKDMPISKLSLPRKRKDYSLIKHLPLTSFVAGEFFMQKDMKLLKGMPLKELTLPKSISDISVLKGMPLEKLNLSYCRNLKNINVLKNMKLTYLKIPGTLIKDISILKGMPLEYLDISSSKITDISALKGMPLTYLNIENTKIKNFKELQKCQQLIELKLPKHFTIDDLKELKYLRNLEKVKISDKWIKVKKILKDLRRRK